MAPDPIFNLYIQLAGGTIVGANKMIPGRVRETGR